MKDNDAAPQINVSKIPGGGGIAGALFAVISMVIFLVGIPLVRFFLPAAIVVGGAVALVIHAIQPKPVGKSWLTSATATKE